MTIKEPLAELDPRYSSEGARPLPWDEARQVLEEAELYWLSTVRIDGRPHVTPVIGVWTDGALYFATGMEEQKAKNIARNPHVILTTGCNELNDGLDLVLEGEADRVWDETRLQAIADRYEAEYGSDWHFDVQEGCFVSDGGAAWVFEVEPTLAYGYGKGDPFTHTRWKFSIPLRRL